MTNERLRQSIEQLTKDTAAEWQAGYEAGVEQERAKIVAWLRSEQISTEKLRDEMNRHTAGWHFADEHASSLEQSAAAIERGEHMQEQADD